MGLRDNLSVKNFVSYCDKQQKNRDSSLAWRGLGWVLFWYLVFPYFFWTLLRRKFTCTTSFGVWTLFVSRYNRLWDQPVLLLVNVQFNSVALGMFRSAVVSRLIVRFWPTLNKKNSIVFGLGKRLKNICLVSLDLKWSTPSYFVRLAQRCTNIARVFSVYLRFRTYKLVSVKRACWYISSLKEVEKNCRHGYHSGHACFPDM